MIKKISDIKLPRRHTSAPPTEQPQFKTPEQVAATEAKSTVPLETIPLRGVPDEIKKPKRFRKINLTKKTKIILAIVGGVILLAGGGFAYWHYYGNHPAKKVITKAIVKKPIVPTIVPSTLSGLLVSPSLNQLPVTGIMIENEIDARPQSGLDQAGVVFEALAEGGITRFLALYQDTKPTYIGPVRSARPYYVSWCLGFDCDYAHVGGSPDALTDISAWGVKDLNQFYNGDSYTRITTRYAPHNVYTSIASLNALENSKGYTSHNFQGFPRKVAAPIKTPTASTISMSLGSADYNVVYTYNAATNSYPRAEGGAPMMNVDANGNPIQITPKVVIAIVVPFSQGALDASNAYYSDYAVVGSGTAYVFQDGGVTIGTWQKTDNSTQITFADTASKPILLNPGQTWITALTTSGDLTYQ